MFIPKDFKVEDLKRLLQFIEKNSFGVLFSQDDDGPQATHIPFILENTPKTVLTGHIAKANPQWKTLDGKEVLIVFSGPHSYISASWYKDSRNVPTWNYVAVHVKGKVEIVTEEKQLLEILEKSVQFYEKELQDPWKMEYEEETVTRLLNGILGFRIHIDSIEGKWKLNQNKSRENREEVIHNLRREKIYMAEEIADLMENENS